MINKVATKLDYALILALIIPIFAVMPLLIHAGLPNSADGPAHLMRQVELNQAWQQGNYYPRWGTDLALGHGMPIFSYAPPALYQATQIFHSLGLPLDVAMKAVLVVTFLLYSTDMFLFSRRVLGPYPALLAATVYVYAPYRLREAYIQGNYGQFIGLACYPLIFWAFHGLITDGRPRYLITSAIALAGLLLSHNISSMLFAPILAAYLIFLLALTAHRATITTDHPVTASILHHLTPPLSRTLTAGLLGLGLSAIFWLPAFGERHDIKLEGITQGFFDFRENFISTSEFFSPPLPLDLTAINPEFPLSLGLPQIILAALGVVSLIFLLVKATIQRTKSPSSTAFPPGPSPPRPLSPLAHTLFFTLFFTLYAYLALPISQPTWEAVPLLELAEFPWRMLGPALFCASFLAGGAYFNVANLLSPSKTPTSPAIKLSRFEALVLLGSIFMTIVLNTYYLYPSQFISWGTPTPADAFVYEITSGAIGTTSTGEFLPRGARQHPQPDTLWPDYEAGRPPQKLDPTTLPDGASVEIIRHLAEADILHLNTPQEFVATFRTLYWPGWRLYLNDQPLSLAVMPNTGLIQAVIPAGDHTVALKLETTPLRQVGKWLTIASAIILAGLVVIVFLKRGKHLPSVDDSRSVRAEPVTSPQFLGLTAALLIITYLLSRPLAPWFTLQSDPNHPQPADRVVQVDFGDQLALVGLDELPQVVQPNRTGQIDLVATLYWRALQDLETNYSIFIHLDAPNGQTFATVDQAHPENIPTRNWPPGLYLRNQLHLEIPPGVPPIRYDVNVGAYNRQTNERLVVAADQTTAFPLGSLWVAPRQTNSTAPAVAHFGPHLTLFQPVFDDQRLVLSWQTSQALEPNQTIFIHLLDRNGDLLGQLDGSPYDDLYPLHHWYPNQRVRDIRVLVPSEYKNKINSIAIGVYDTVSGDRLPAIDGEGNLLPNHAFVFFVKS